ncbi:MAG TPA: DnaA/Hda family protein, partial [Rhodanobacteraceae bacterium]
MNRQFPLDLRWPPHQRLDAFWPGANVPALGGVIDVANGGGAWLYLHGASGTGKSHLLIGACRAAIEANHPARYVSLAQLPTPRFEAIAAIAAGGLLAIDDVQAIVADHEAERALFDLYNRAKAAKARMAFAAPASPAELGITLPDLVSRLSM